MGCYHPPVTIGALSTIRWQPISCCSLRCSPWAEPTPPPHGGLSWPHREKALRTRTAHKQLFSPCSSVFQILFQTPSSNKITEGTRFHKTNPAAWKSGQRFGESPSSPGPSRPGDGEAQSRASACNQNKPQSLAKQ